MLLAVWRNLEAKIGCVRGGVVYIATGGRVQRFVRTLNVIFMTGECRGSWRDCDGIKKGNDSTDEMKVERAARAGVCKEKRSGKKLLWHKSGCRRCGGDDWEWER